MKTKTLHPRPVAVRDPGEEPIPAGDLFQILTETQTTAIDMRRRGINVIPLPGPYEVRAQPDYDPANVHKKPPYGLLAWFFFNRLHICGPDCFERERRTGRKCLPPGATFFDLFLHCNIGAILGRISGNLTSLDCDTAEAFQKVIEAFQERWLNFWAFTSHDGRGHVMFILAEGEAANNDVCKIKGVNIMGHSHYVCLPPSVHPSGECYTWLKATNPYYYLPMGEKPPKLHLADLDFLGIELRYKKGDKRTYNLEGLPESVYSLPKEQQRILTTRPAQDYRNIAITSVLYQMVALLNNDLMYQDEITDILEWFANRCTPPYPERQLASMIKSAIKRKDLKLAHRPNGPQPWEFALSFAASYTWTGRTGQTDRAVFLACCRRSQLDGKELFRASTREVAELANLGDKSTAKKSLLRLIAAGLLKRIVQDERSQALIYKFTDTVLKQPCDKNRLRLLPHYQRQGEDNGVISEGVKVASIAMTLTTQEQDYFKNHKVAYRVWEYLCQVPATVTGTAKATGQSLSAVSESIKTLVAHGLVTRNAADGLCYGEKASNDKLERLAAVRGTLGYSDRRKREHVREREIRLSLRTAAKEAAYRANARR